MALTLTLGKSYASTATENNVSVGMPTTLVAGDYTILVVSINLASASITQPAGWSVILPSTASTASTSHAVAVYYKAYVAGDPTTVTVTAGGTCRIAAFTIRVQGADPVNLLDTAVGSTAQSAAATAIVAPSVTTVTANAVLCVVAAGRDNTSGETFSFTPPTGMTELADVAAASTSANNAGAELSTLLVPTSGTATGTKTATSSVTLTGSRGVAFALRPAAAVTTAGLVKVWNGTAWVSKPLKVWNGTAWVAKPVKVNRNGTWGLSK